MTIDNNTRERTAHELWVALAQERILAITYPDSIRDGKYSFMTSRDTLLKRAEEAAHFIQHFETTRLRLNLDGIIDKLEASEKRAQELHAEHQATPWFRFRHRARLIRQHKDQRIMQEAFKQAVLHISNTPPPTLEVPVKAEGLRPEPPTSLRTACDQCQGTGYAGGKPGLDVGLCGHCKGSGTEPEAAS